MIYELSNEFLTDPKLIFNWDMYNHMFNKQFKPYMTEKIFYLGLFGLILSLFLGLKKQRVALLSFLFGSLVYWVLASKVIFFHNYYTHIIMITFCLSIGVLTCFFSKLFRNKYLFIFFLILVGLLIFPTSYNANTQRLRKEKDDNYLERVAQFLIENTNEGEIYIDNSNLLTLTLMTGRPRIEESELLNKEIISSVQKIGFSKTMEKYNISYLVTLEKEPRYERYVSLFTEQELKSVSYRRSDIIKSRLYPDYEYFPDIDIRNKIIELQNIKDKFVLEREIGPYKLFTFKN